MNALEVTQPHLNAWNRHDADAIVALFAEGGTHRTPRMDHARHQVWKVVGLIVLVCGLQLSGAQGVTFITFDAPGAITGSSQGTVPTAINPTGVITGNYIDSFFAAFHGFVRALDGTITTFDAPGAGTQPNQGGTLPTAINPAGVITGFFLDAIGVNHGFLRARNGTFTFIDPTVGGVSTTLTSTFTMPAVNGNAVANLASGTATQFTIGGIVYISPIGYLAITDMPGTDQLTLQNLGYSNNKAPGSTAPNGNTLTASGNAQPFGINPAGAITGFYLDSSLSSHGFLRTPGGSFTTFDPAPEPPASFTFTFPQAINPAGVITGLYEDVNGIHFFLRHLDTTFTPFDNLPGGILGFVQPNMVPLMGINPAGVITGFYQTAVPLVPFINRGFVRAPNGTITAFDAPGAVLISQGVLINFGTGTQAIGINPAGAITGFFSDASTCTAVNHGFLRARNGTFTFIDPTGPTGGGASTTLTSTFTMPAVNGNAVANVADASFSCVGTIVYISPIGYLAIIGMPDTIHLTLQNLGYSNNKAPSSTAPNGNTLTAASVPVQANAINPAGEITGNYIGTDSFGNKTSHGFLRIPSHEDKGEGPGGGD